MRPVSLKGPYSRPQAHTVERWLGALPAYARPDARSLLLVGLGGGVSIEAVPASIERIDVVELEPAIIAAAEFLAPLRRDDPLSDPRVRVVLNDARAALALTRQRFDVIVSQPSRPWVGGSSHMYTREFALAVREGLTPGGVFAQWMGLNFVDAQGLGTVIATLFEAFEHVRIYRPGWRSGLVLLASNEPLDPARTAPSLIEADPDVALRLGITRAADIEAALLLDTAGARRLAEGAPVNRDRHDRLAGHAARRVREAARGGAYYEPPALPPSDDSTDAVALARHGRRSALSHLAMIARDPAERERAHALIARLRGREEHAAALEASHALRDARIARRSCDEHLEQGEYVEALAALDRAARLSGSGGADALRRARAAAALGDASVAAESARAALLWLEGSQQASLRPPALETLTGLLGALSPEEADLVAAGIARLR